MTRVGIIGFLILLVGLACLPAMANGNRHVPAPAAMVMNKAEHLLAAGKIQESITLLKAFQSKRENVSTAKADSRGYTHYLVDFILGNSYLMLEDPAAALRHYQLVAGRQPDFVQARFNLARALYDLDRAAEAGQAFVAAYEISGSQDTDALYYGAVCFMRAEDYPRALTIFERLMENSPRELPLEWRSTLARLYLVMEMPGRALAHVKFLADQPDGRRQKEWRETLIYLYLQLDMRNKGLACAATFTRDDPLDPDWWKIHAWLLLGQQDFRRALTSLTAFSYLQPLSEDERVLLADVNLMTGVPIEAIRYYEQQLALEKDAGLIKKTARSYLRLYDEQQALAWVERGLEASPADKDLLRMKGYFLYEADRLDEAAAVYTRLAEILPQSGDIWLMRGYIAWRQNDFKAAREAFSRAGDGGRYADQARKALAQLR